MAEPERTDQEPEPFVDERAESLITWFYEQQLMIICPFAAFDNVGPVVMKLFGTCLCIALWVLMLLQLYVTTVILSPLIHKRFGTELGLLWMMVGLVLLYNTLYNHFLAMIIRPGNVKDLKMIEGMRKE